MKGPRIALTALAAVVAALVLAPLAWMVSVSLMQPGAAGQFLPPFLPDRPTLANYRALFETQDMARFLVNSALVSILATALGLAFTLPAGYAFAKLRYRGRGATLRALLALLLIPGQIGMLPLFLELKAMGLVNSYAGVLVPWLAGIVGLFLVRQYALAIPDELLEAARIDGAGEWAIFRHIALPVMGPAIATLAVFVFLGSWNDFMWPLIVLSDQNLYTLPVALAAIGRERAQDIELMMAGSVVTTVPVLALFLLVQRRFIGGLMNGSIKG